MPDFVALCRLLLWPAALLLPLSAFLPRSNASASALAPGGCPHCKHSPPPHSSSSSAPQSSFAFKHYRKTIRTFVHFGTCLVYAAFLASGVRSPWIRAESGGEPNVRAQVEEGVLAAAGGALLIFGVQLIGHEALQVRAPSHAPPLFRSLDAGARCGPQARNLTSHLTHKRGDSAPLPSRAVLRRRR